MDAQPQLFAPSTNGRLAPALPPHNFTRPSIDAARRVSRRVKTDRERILAMLSMPYWKRQGANQQEVADTLGMERATVAARMNGLERDGLVFKRGTRKTRANVAAGVYFRGERTGA